MKTTDITSNSTHLDGEYIFSVSELNHSTKVFLEQHFGQVYVSGEISNFSQPSSMHIYFTLKDSNAQVRCAFFRHKQIPGTKLQNGMQIIVGAQLSLYPERGEYQLLINKVFDAGLGLLQQQYAALKEKLAAAGLFSEEHKKPIPTHPKSIGVITSETGAALQDVLTVLKRRCPSINVYLYPCQVQGTDAPVQLINAIKLANQYPKCDVLLLTRGGGSIEDLWAFNNEALAHAIYQSILPIVSAVGHEVDFTIADFVADKRAPTPSAAAEMLSPNRDDLLIQVKHFSNALCKRIQQHLQTRQHHLAHLQKRLIHPRERLAHKAQHLDHLSIRLYLLAEQTIKRYQHRMQLLINRLNRHSPILQLNQNSQQFQQYRTRLQLAIQSNIKDQLLQMRHLAEKLHTLSPLTTLERGFAIVQNAQSTIIKNSKDVAKGEEITIRLSQGQILCVVKSLN